MFHSKALLSLILISSAVVDASPLSRSTGKATLSFATRINESGTLNIVDKDRARAQAFKNADHLGKRDGSISVTNSAVTYTAQVGVGNPATEYTLLIDTGSSNTWIGASKTYSQTCTSQDTWNTVSVSYGSGNFSGEEWTDTVTLGSGLVIENQSIGVASFATGFTDVDGILGIGPVGLTANTVSNTDTVPTVTDNLLSQGTISEEVIGIYYVPASESSSTGELTFGDYDKSMITSSVRYTSLTTSSPASNYWGINQSISYGGTTIQSTTSGIVDTGTTLILIASDAFQQYQSATGATLDSATGLLTITSTQYSDLQTLSFNIGDTSYDLSPNAQIWPRSLNSVIGGSSGSIYLVVSDIGSPSGSGLDFIDGYTFLERYYSVFDTTNGRVGFATTAYTDATIN
ncbi:family A1 protease [Boletus edulis BED1]|uniref:Family A1 protease n=1 Tax=Boletus edulis BED1 TaxID=1328754 RepID=A0AAD4C501_BOLED|nr:family A1 protease [Boletus edulis BED1]